MVSIRHDIKWYRHYLSRSSGGRRTKKQCLLVFCFFFLLCSWWCDLRCYFLHRRYHHYDNTYYDYAETDCFHFLCFFSVASSGWNRNAKKFRVHFRHAICLVNTENVIFFGFDNCRWQFSCTPIATCFLCIKSKLNLLKAKCLIALYAIGHHRPRPLAICCQPTLRCAHSAVSAGSQVIRLLLPLNATKEKPEMIHWNCSIEEASDKII